MLVRMPPGWTVTAETPVPRSSWRSESVKPRTANFEAQYELWYGMPTSPNTLEVLTITPLSCSTRIGRKARVPFTTPSKLMANSQSWSSVTASSTLAAVATPALLNTAPSGLGAHCRTSAAKSRWAAASVTSSTRVRAGPDSEASVSFSAVSSMSLSATGQPCADSRCARLRPIPEPAPLTTTVLPARCLRRDFGIDAPLLCGLRCGQLHRLWCCRLAGGVPPVGVVDDGVDQAWPGRGGQVVAHAFDGGQPGAGNRSSRRDAAAVMDHPVQVAVHDDGRRADPGQVLGPVAGREDRGELADHPARVGVAVEGTTAGFPYPHLVEREALRADVAEQPHRPVHRLFPAADRSSGHAQPGARRRPADLGSAGVGHHRGQRAGPARHNLSEELDEQ